MESTGQLFVTAEEWKKRYWSPKVKCIIWGTGLVAGEVRETLRFLEVPVYAYGDNDVTKQGTMHEGRPVLSAAELKDMESFCVLIGSYVVRPVYEQMRDLGVQDIFVLLDALKYPAEELRQERKLLEPYFAGTWHRQGSGRTLVEVYGDIGDLLIKTGLIRGLEEVMGRENICVLVEDDAVREVLQEIFLEVIAAPREKLVKDGEFRLKFLRQLNGHCFSQSIVLCDARLHANRRLLNSHNFNAAEVYFARVLPDQEYLPELDRQFLLDHFPELANRDCSPLHLFDKACIRCFPKDFPYRKKSYVVVNLGARKEVRHYEVGRFRDVVAFLLSRNIPVVLVGRGAYDRSWAAEVKGGFTEGIIDCVDKCSLMESISIISFAMLFVGTDSGMWNASYVSETPSVVLYGLGEYGCFMHRDAFVHYAMAEDRSCLGCRWFCNNRTTNGRAMCLESITPAKIIGKIKEVLDER